ncbi:MAG TPA: resolvase [Micromonosporaceae bacterium]|nr:resolvase [Micromonosporaceae bacterium]
MAKPELRAAARELRLLGHTYDEIATKLGVSKSSVSLWVRDILRVDTPERARQRQEHVKAMAEARWSGYRQQRDERRAAVRTAAADTVTDLSREELLRLGALIYWCEGTKAKAWREHGQYVIFTNSDPVLISVFLCFLRAAGVGDERLQFRLSIHENADVDAAVTWWAAAVGVSSSDFLPTTLKRHNPKTARLNTADRYRGCLVVRVRRSRELYWMIEGLVRGMQRAASGVGRAGSG